MTMHINLSPEMENFIKGKVASGYYGNATEVIRDAIRRMQSEELRLAAWKAALEQGDDEIDARQGVPYTKDTLEEITRSAKAMGTRAVDPDVLP